jgi:hypothetical protein
MELENYLNKKDATNNSETVPILDKMVINTTMNGNPNRRHHIDQNNITDNTQIGLNLKYDIKTNSNMINIGEHERNLNLTGDNGLERVSKFKSILNNPREKDNSLRYSLKIMYTKLSITKQYIYNRSLVENKFGLYHRKLDYFLKNFTKNFLSFFNLDKLIGNKIYIKNKTKLNYKSLKTESKIQGSEIAGNSKYKFDYFNNITNETLNRLTQNLDYHIEFDRELTILTLISKEIHNNSLDFNRLVYLKNVHNKAVSNLMKINFIGRLMPPKTIIKAKTIVV